VVNSNPLGIYFSAVSGDPTIVIPANRLPAGGVGFVLQYVVLGTLAGVCQGPSITLSNCSYRAVYGPADTIDNTGFVSTVFNWLSSIAITDPTQDALVTFQANSMVLPTGVTSGVLMIEQMD